MGRIVPITEEQHHWAKIADEIREALDRRVDAPWRKQHFPNGARFRGWLVKTMPYRLPKNDDRIDYNAVRFIGAQLWINELGNEVELYLKSSSTITQRLLEELVKTNYQSETNQEQIMNPQTTDPIEQKFCNQTPAFQVLFLIFGQNADNMSDRQLINAIHTIEAEINYLRKVETKSKKIKAKIEELTESIEKIVELLDKR